VHKFLGLTLMMHSSRTAQLSAFASIATLLISSAAFAQDSIPAAFRDGSYLTIGTGESNLSLYGATLKGDGEYGSNAADEAANVRSSGPQYSVSVGYEFAKSATIIHGIEASVSKFDGEHINYDLRGNGSISASVAYDQGPLISLRSKIGEVRGATMFFGTLGPALLTETQTRTQYIQVGNTNSTTTSFSESDTKIRFGAAMSVGVRQAIAHDWSMSVELQHFLLAPATFHFDEARAGASSNYEVVNGRQAESTFENTVLLIGLTRKF
jgi:hypothetical protein